MTKAERDRLVALKKAKKKLITQREAAEELRLSVRHVKRLIHALKKRGIEARKETVRQWMLRAKLWLGEEGQGPRRSYMAAAAEPVRGADAVGHERPRLAGGAWRAAVSDRDDRRRHEPIMRAIRAARFHRREYEAAVELRGKVRPAGGVLYRQSEPVPQ